MLHDRVVRQMGQHPATGSMIYLLITYKTVSPCTARSKPTCEVLYIQSLSCIYKEMLRVCDPLFSNHCVLGLGDLGHNLETHLTSLLFPPSVTILFVELAKSLEALHVL